MNGQSIYFLNPITKTSPHVRKARGRDVIPIQHLIQCRIPSLYHVLIQHTALGAESWFNASSEQCVGRISTSGFNTSYVHGQWIRSNRSAQILTIHWREALLRLQSGKPLEEIAKAMHGPCKGDGLDALHHRNVCQMPLLSKVAFELDRWRLGLITNGAMDFFSATFCARHSLPYLCFLVGGATSPWALATFWRCFGRAKWSLSSASERQAFWQTL